jgi:dihydroorotase
MKKVYRNLSYLEPGLGLEAPQKTSKTSRIGKPAKSGKAPKAGEAEPRLVDLVFEAPDPACEGGTGTILSMEDAKPRRRYDDSFHVEDRRGQSVGPGFIDLYAFPGEPGFELDEDFASFAACAAAGGYTTVAPRPDTQPSCDRRVMVESLLRRASEVGLVDVIPVGAARRDGADGTKGRDMAEIGDMWKAGARAVSSGDRPFDDGSMMRRLLEYAAAFGLVVVSRPEDKVLAGDGLITEGEMSTRLGLPGAPTLAEEVAVYRDLSLAAYTGGRLHLTKVSTAGSVELIRQARAEGVRVTCDVSAAHLLLTEKELAGFDTNLKLVPPLRSNDDRLALVAGVMDGTVDAVVSDHAPVNRRYKECEFAYARPGALGLETAWPLLLRLVKRGELSLSVALAALTTGPARVLGLEPPALAEGAPATFTLWDEAARYRYTPALVRSKSLNSPFVNWELRGRIMEVRLRGAETWSALTDSPS